MSHCRGKKAYLSKVDADRSLRIVQRSRNKLESRPVRSYRCPHCRQWHLTSNKTHAVEERPR